MSLEKIRIIYTVYKHTGIIPSKKRLNEKNESAALFWLCLLCDRHINFEDFVDEITSYT